MKIEYNRQGEHYYPNLVPPENLKNFELGRFGRMRLKFLKEQKKAEYIILFMNNKLREHLLEIDKTANDRFEFLMKQLAKKENITEELKATNQLEWVGKMNNLKNSIEEIILERYIYN